MAHIPTVCTGRRIVTYTLLAIFICICASLIFLLRIKGAAYDSAMHTPLSDTEAVADTTTPEPFPLGVNPFTKTITEHTNVDTFFETHIAKTPSANKRTSWFKRTVAKLAQSHIFQNLASPISRILVIQPGERKEQIAKNFGDILRWNVEERRRFTNMVTESTPEIKDGTYFPGSYTVLKDATPEQVAQLVIDRFNKEIASRYSDTTETFLPMKDALIIASLLEREAYDFTDMRYIAGIIWNRLFIDMNLQLDASLQYAKGSRPYEPWWPKVVPDDKYIDSLYNTYKHDGLPPEPIANPAPEAVLAALNPRNTDCIFYFHDTKSRFYCSVTYEEHVAKLKKVYGRGR